MSYGMQIRLSSGLTNIDDVYTVRPKEEHELDKGTSNITIYANQDVSYGTFTNFGIDFDSSTDAFFVTKFSYVIDPNVSKIDHWEDHYVNFWYGLDLAHTLVLDDVNETVKLVWQNRTWDSLTIQPNSGTNFQSVALYIEFKIIKIKAS